MLNTVLIHNCTREFVYPVERNTLEFKLTSNKGKKSEISLICWNNLREDDTRKRIKMELNSSDNDFNYYRCQLTVDDAVRYLRYYFEISSSQEKLYLGANGKREKKPQNGFFEYHYTNENDVFKTPNWIKGAVFYQVFPERFCNGDFSNDPSNVEKWGAVPTRENFFGGDIQGIISKLDYLSELEIDAIYLVKQCHERGIKVVLDGVFNHCGYYFEPFQDVIRNGEKSKYKSWFYIAEFPVQTDPANYECVGYYKWMPKLRHANQEVRDYVLGVGEYWIKELDIDGWRLDVADEVDFTLWQEFRRRVKAVKKDAVIIGETWTDGRDLLRGDQMDSIMNYLFRDAVVQFVAKGTISACEFGDIIGKMFSIYQSNVYDGLYNLIGSHDTERFLTLCDNDIRKLKLAVGMQMTFPGAPAIYYGDEIGMLGENDPGCRGGMSWSDQNDEIKEFYMKMIRIRKRTEALTKGSFHCIVCEDGLYGYARKHDSSVVYVIINNNEEKRTIKVPIIDNIRELTYKSVLSDNTYHAKNMESKKASHNSDMDIYNGFFEIELEGFNLEIIKKEER